MSPAHLACIGLYTLLAVLTFLVFLRDCLKGPKRLGLTLGISLIVGVLWPVAYAIGCVMKLVEKPEPVKPFPKEVWDYR